MIDKLLLQLPDSIETERLVLRSYRAGDGPWVYAVSRRNREHLARYESQNALQGIESEEEAEILVRQLAVDWISRRAFFLAALERAGGEFAAQVYVGPKSWALPEFEIGYIVDRDHEGQGFVGEAVRVTLGWVFEHLHAHRLTLHCDDTNTRSARVAERCGFRLEGHLREDKRNTDGTLTGTLCYGLLRREFEG